MNQLKIVLAVSLLGMSGQFGIANAQAKQSQDLRPKRQDVAKRVIESPLIKTIDGTKGQKENSLLQVRSHANRRIDPSKSRIESPVKNLLNGKRPTPLPKVKTPPQKRDSNSQKPKEMKEPTVDTNPLVRPGLISWHPNIPRATEASHRSGKPVLIFYLLGQLDREFT